MVSSPESTRGGQYDAFISYCHGADSGLALALRRALHRIARPWYRLRALSTFLDKTDLAANPALWPAIEGRLAGSAYLVLIASPAAAASPWVGREVAWWIEHRTPETILIAVAGGDIHWSADRGDFDWVRTTALPSVLVGKLRYEPLYSDFRPSAGVARASFRDRAFRAAALDIAAPLHGKPKADLAGEDVRRQRSARLLAFALVGLFLAATYGFFDQRQLAGRRAEQQRKMVSDILYKAHDQLVRLPGSTDARQAIIDLATENLNNIAADAGENLEVLRDLAAAYDRLADVQGSQSLASRGDFESAGESLKRSGEIWKKLATLAPDDVTVRHGIAAHLDRLGGIESRLGETSAALTDYRKAAVQFRALASDHPDDPQYARAEGFAYDKIGSVQLYIGEFADALASFSAALEVSERLQGKSRQSMRDLAVSHKKVADALKSIGDDEGAGEHYRESLKLHESLASVIPEDPQAKRDLGTCYKAVGMWEMGRGDLAAARAHFEKVVAIDEAINATGVDDAERQGDLSSSHDDLGDVLLRSGKIDASIDEFRISVNIQEKLVKAHPEHSFARRYLASSHERLGQALRMRGESRESLREYQIAATNLAMVVQQDPDNTLARRYLDHVHDVIAELTTTR